MRRRDLLRALLCAPWLSPLAAIARPGEADDATIVARFGTLPDPRHVRRVYAAGPPAGVLVALVPMALLRWRINLLSLPDEEASALGVDVARLRLILVAAATLGTAAAVSLTGIIGWIGLVVPHVARLLVGPDFVRLLPASLMLGAGFLVATDTLARSVAPIELPLSILTALIGAPFFLYLLARAGRER